MTAFDGPADYETGTNPKVVSESRQGCRLPIEATLQTGEGTITLEEYRRRSTPTPVAGRLAR